MVTGDQAQAAGTQGLASCSLQPTVLGLCPWPRPTGTSTGAACVCTGACMPGRVRVCAHACACTALVPGGRSLLRELDPPSVTARGWGWAQGTRPPRGPCTSLSPLPGTSLSPVPGTSPHLIAVLGHLQPWASLSSPRRAPRAPGASPGSAAPNPTRPATTQLFGTAAPQVGSRASLGYPGSCGWFLARTPLAPDPLQLILLLPLPPQLVPSCLSSIATFHSLQ